MKAAGVCLLVMLFSFGMFYNAQRSHGEHPPLPASVSASTGMVRNANGITGSAHAVKTSRNLLQADEEIVPSAITDGRPVQNVVEIKTEKPEPARAIRATPQPLQLPNKIQIDASDSPRRGPAITTPKRKFDDLVVNDDTDSETDEEEAKRTTTRIPPSFGSMTNNESLSGNLSKLLTSADIQSSLITHGAWLDDSVKVRPNTIYFKLNSFRQLIPPKNEPFDSSAPFYMSFLVPARSLMTGGKYTEPDKPWVEILTQVVDVGMPGHAFENFPVVL